MKMNPKIKNNILYRIMTEFFEADMPVYAANSTFFIILAAMPMFMLTLSVINLIPQYDAQAFIAFLKGFLPDVPEIHHSVEIAITGLHKQSTVAVISISALTSLISASSGIYALLKGLRKVYNLTDKSFLWNRIRAVLSTFIFLIALMLMISTQFLQRPIENVVIQISRTFLLEGFMEWLFRITHIIGMISILFAFLTILLLYAWLPGNHDSLRGNIPGALFTVLGWVLVSRVFKYYIRYFWKASPIYGSLGAVVLLALWLYVIMNLIFLGAVLNKALQ